MFPKRKLEFLEVSFSFLFYADLAAKETSSMLSAKHVCPGPDHVQFAYRKGRRYFENGQLGEVRASVQKALVL